MMLALWEAERLGLGSAEVLALAEQARQPGNVLKRDARQWVGRAQHRGQPLIVKYRHQGVAAALLRMVLVRRVGRLRRAAQHSQASAELAGIRAFYCIAGHGWVVLLDDVQAEATLREALQRAQTDAERERRVRGALDALLALHRRGLAHGDAKWNNFVHTGQGWRMVDVERVRAGAGALRERAIARDLARFFTSARDTGFAEGQIRAWIEASTRERAPRFRRRVEVRMRRFARAHRYRNHSVRRADVLYYAVDDRERVYYWALLDRDLRNCVYYRHERWGAGVWRVLGALLLRRTDWLAGGGPDAGASTERMQERGSEREQSADAPVRFGLRLGAALRYASMVRLLRRIQPGLLVLRGDAHPLQRACAAAAQRTGVPVAVIRDGSDPHTTRIELGAAISTIPGAATAFPGSEHLEAVRRCIRQALQAAKPTD